MPNISEEVQKKSARIMKRIMDERYLISSMITGRNSEGIATRIG